MTADDTVLIRREDLEALNFRSKLALGGLERYAQHLRAQAASHSGTPLAERFGEQASTADELAADLRAALAPLNAATGPARGEDVPTWDAARARLLSGHGPEHCGVLILARAPSLGRARRLVYGAAEDLKEGRLSGHEKRDDEELYFEVCPPATAGH